MNIDEYLNELQSNLDNQLARFGMGEQPAGNADNTEETEEKKFCPECGKQVTIDANFCSNCGFHFQDDNMVEESREQPQAPAGKRKFKVSFACRPYCIQMFKADEELKQRCLEAAANEELSEFWGDYAYDEGDYCFDYEREVLTWDSRMDFSVYDEDDNEIFHTEDMGDFELWGERDEELMQNEYNLSSDLHSQRYPLTKNNLGYKVRQQGIRCNVFVLRPSSDIVNFDSRNLLVAFRIAILFQNLLDADKGINVTDVQDLGTASYGYTDI